MRIAFYGVGEYPRFLSEENVPDENCHLTLRKFWQESGGFPVTHLLVIE